MYTQCPNCQTIFEVTAEHLKAANGDVRCGQCLNVFSALDHLSEELPAQSDTENEELFQTPEQAAVFDETTPTTSEDAGQPVTEASSTDSPDTAVTPTDQDDPSLSEFFSEVVDDSAEFTEIDFETRRKKEKPLSPDGGFFYGGANEATIDKILNEQVPAERELEEFTLPSDATSEPDEEKSIVKEKNETDSPPSDIPARLLEDLQAGQLAEQKATSNRFWLTGSVILMLVLVTQAVYFSRHDLAKNPAYRPLLAQACEMIGCTINVTYDIKQIEIIGRDVRTHPSASNALIAGTTIINNAKFPQPYPLLTLTFSDINGTTLAQRRFTPREYLKSGSDIPAGMTPDLPVQVELELVDPGKAAVNFEFHAETDPRAITPIRG